MNNNNSYNKSISILEDKYNEVKNEFQNLYDNY